MESRTKDLDPRVCQTLVETWAIDATSRRSAATTAQL
jgi:hypothetical protein